MNSYGKSGARRRSLQHLHSLQNNELVREAARQAVEAAAQDALFTVFNSRPHDNSVMMTTKEARRPSADSASSKASRLSFSPENFEPKDGAAKIDGVVFDGRLYLEQTELRVGVASGTTTSPSSEIKQRKWSILKRAQRLIPNQKLNLASEISNEAWMCGVCSKSFSSFAVAQRHEDYHIQEVVSDLGWGDMQSHIDQHSGIISVGSVRDQESHAATLPLLGAASVETDLLASSSEPPITPLRTPSQRHRASFQTPNTSMPRPDMLQLSTAPSTMAVARHAYNTPALQRKRKAKALIDQGLEDSSWDDDLLNGSTEFDLTASIVKPFVAPHTSMSLVEKRSESKNEFQTQNYWGSDEHDLLVPHSMRNYVVLADEALADVCEKAKPWLLTSEETEAEMELDKLAQDKAYYDTLYIRSLERQRGGTYDHFRVEGKSVLSKVQNKFVDAYQLIKDGKAKRKKNHMDHYTRKLKGDIDTLRILENNKRTLYFNVIVKASLKVVSYELQRLASQRWEAAQAKMNENDSQTLQFQQFRALAQDNLVKLAGMALAADFTPRRIAIQLSNDFYRLLTPRLKRRGVTIETEIEYRVGPYFVLSVNVKKVDWRRLVRAAHRDVEAAKSRWRLEQEEKIDDVKTEAKEHGVIMSFLFLCYRLTQLTKYEVLAQFLAWCYYLHWGLYTPICFILYQSFLGELFRRYFLATVSDEIFYYVEQKGMEMDIAIRNASTQTAFMLSALREIRADGRELRKKRQDEEDKGTILGPLLGPAIQDDKGPAPPKPEGFEMPANLEYVGLELELPVGFRRLRWALLSSKSTFVTDAIFRTESKYENITVGTWSKHDEEVGMGVLPDGIKEEDIVGAEKELSYLMPKSVFVKANMCYETAYIDMYNEYCFVLRKKALTPEVPYGSTFVAWTKYIVINTGGNTCKLICSVEPEFPNGPPMISRQITGGMRAGVGELFVKTGETISKYADHFP